MQPLTNMKLSLTNKLIATSLAVEVVLLFFHVWNDTKLTQNQLLTQKQQEISKISNLVSTAIASALSRNDMAEVFDIVKVSKSPDINYIEIKAQNNETISQAGISKHPKPTSVELLRYIDSAEQADSYPLMMPLENNKTPLGTLYIEFNISDINRMLADVQRHGIQDAVIIVAATVILLYLLLTALTKNLRNLTMAMSEYIASRHVSTPIAHSNDEVGKLGETFEELTTTLRNKEDSLQESESLLQAILDNSPAIIFAKDQDGKYMLANKQLAGFFHLPVDDILGKTDFELFPSEIAARLQQDDKTILANKSVQQLEEAVPYENELKTYLSIKFCLFDKNNAAYAVCGISTDISERIRNEQRLKESEENLRSLANNAIDGILVNKKGKHVFTNQRMADMLNTSVEEILGSDQDYVVHPSERDNVVQRFKRRLQGQQEPIQYDTLFSNKKTGEPVPVELAAFISQWDGEPAGVVFVRDIKERKQIEAELKKYRERLEKMVSARTAELERAVTELETFSYSVSHDLRSPLRSIDGFSQILLEDHRDQLDETGINHLIRVRKATQRMAQLIDDILLLSRVSRHKLSIKAVNLSDIAEQSAGYMTETHPERRVNIKIEPNMNAKGDYRLLQIVMDNLLDNAWKYTGKNAEAYVECGCKVENGAQIYFVKDNGIGFDMQYAHKLFGAFQRLHATDEFPGTGIGLATVKRIIDRHGGQIWAESKPNLGTTFYFTLD